MEALLLSLLMSWFKVGTLIWFFFVEWFFGNDYDDKEIIKPSMEALIIVTVLCGPIAWIISLCIYLEDRKVIKEN